MSDLERAGAESDRDAPGGRGRRPAVRAAQIALVGATVVFLALALARSWDQVAAYEWTLKPGWLVASLVVFALYYWTQAAGWWLLLAGMGLASRFLATCAIWGSSILARYIPGTVFMFVGRAWLHHAQGLDLSRVAAAMVYEQALQVCSALVAIALLWPLARAGPAWASWSLLAVPVLLVLLHPRAFLPLADRTLRLLHREPLAASLPFGLVLAMLWYYVATWLLVGAGAWLLARATVDAEGDALALVAAAYALAYVAGMVAFIVPSGVGVREAVLAGALRTEFGGGVALAWALLLRLWQTAAEVLFVGMVVAADRASRPSVTGWRAPVDGREDATMKERE